jgi:P pilus assembly chaperone PapD
MAPRWARFAARTCVLLGAVALAAAPVHAQVSVDELELHLKLAAVRAPITQVIPVRNEERRAQQVTISMGDWMRDSSGNNAFLEYESTSASCQSRLRVFPTTLQIAPGATELVRVTYTPTPADTGCWAIVYIEAVQPPPAVPNRQGSFVTFEIRTGVKIYVHRHDAVAAGQADTAFVQESRVLRDPLVSLKDSIDIREAVVRFLNTGTEHIRVQSTVEIRSLDNRLLHTVKGDEAPMTPGSARYLRVRMPELVRGQYVAVVLLDYGGDEIAAAQIDFEVR